jgi:uncharacterized protein YjbI with pentapeptide repeats
MKVINLNKEVIKVAWMASKLSPKIPPHIQGLTASFFVKATFQLHPDKEPTPWPKKPERCSGDKLIDGDKKKGVGYISDFAPYKPYADFAAIGTGYPPAGAKSNFIVRMQVGNHAREIGVVGARTWERSLITEKPGKPAQVKVTQLSWNNARGGPNYPLNLLGCGEAGGAMHLLVDPLHLETYTSEVVAPAVLAPYSKTTPMRRAKLGNYGGDYHKTRWPWFAEDFDYTYYNATDQRQWIKGYLRGDEELLFRNMHAKVPEYRTCLPKLRARCFLTQTMNWSVDLKPKEAKVEFKEIPMDLDTLWVDMDHEKLILVWRGRCQTGSLKLRDLGHLMVMTESLEENTPPLEHYHRLLLEELAVKSPSPPLAPADPAKIMEKIRAASSAARKRRDATKKISPAKVGTAFDAVAKKNDPLIAEKLGVLPPITDDNLKSMPRSHDEMVTHLKQKTGALHTPGDDGMYADLAPEPVPDVAEKAAAIRAKIQDKKSAIKSKFPVRKSKEDFFLNGTLDLDKIRNEGLEKVDMRGVDFSGLDLSGVIFRKAILSKADFSNCKLCKADFTNANMRGAILSSADLCGAVMDNADVTGTMVNGTVWRKTSLNNTKLSRLNLAGADFSDALGTSADFSHTDLTKTDFTRSEFPGASFHKATLEGADFSKAKLFYADFRGTKSGGITMDDADLTKFRGGLKADFTGGSFRRVIATKSVWTSSTLDRTDFLQAFMPQSRLSEALIREANFDRCELTEANFEDSMIEGSTITNANLLRARFSRSDLTRANLNGSNMYQAGFWNTTLLHASWKGANILKTRLDPK